MPDNRAELPEDTPQILREYHAYARKCEAAKDEPLGSDIFEAGWRAALAQRQTSQEELCVEQMLHGPCGMPRKNHELWESQHVGQPFVHRFKAPLNDGFLSLTIDYLHRIERGVYLDPLTAKAYIGFALEVCRAEKRRRETSQSEDSPQEGTHDNCDPCDAVLAERMRDMGREPKLNDGFLNLTIDHLYRFERGEYQDPLTLKAYIGFALQLCRTEKRRRAEQALRPISLTRKQFRELYLTAMTGPMELEDHLREMGIGVDVA